MKIFTNFSLMADSNDNWTLFICHISVVVLKSRRSLYQVALPGRHPYIWQSYRNHRIGVSWRNSQSRPFCGVVSSVKWEITKKLSERCRVFNCNDISTKLKIIKLICSSNFDGMIAVIIPEDSWVCKWQKISRKVRSSLSPLKFKLLDLLISFIKLFWNILCYSNCIYLFLSEVGD